MEDIKVVITTEHYKKFYKLGENEMKNCINNETRHKTTRITDLINLSKIIIIMCIFLTGSVIAQEGKTMSATFSNLSGKNMNQAINMCPGGIAFGIYSFNYEYLFNQSHGLVGRFDYESISDSYSGDPIKANGLGFILNYRWHWSGTMESGFLGSYVRFRTYDGTGTSDLSEFDFNISELTLGLNIGKRWVWNNGLNITFALGYGISTSSKKMSPSNTSVKSTLSTFEDEYSFISPFLGELSIGYAF